MPVYKHKDTGQEAVHTEDFVSSFPEGTWEKVADESEDERRAREREEAALAKVDLDNEDDDGAGEGTGKVGENATTDATPAPDDAPAPKKGASKK